MKERSINSIQELHDKCNNFKRTKTGDVIFRVGGPFGIVEFKEEFIDKLKNELDLKIKLAGAGIEDLSVADKFAIYILGDSD